MLIDTPLPVAGKRPARMPGSVLLVLLGDALRLLRLVRRGLERFQLIGQLRLALLQVLHLCAGLADQPGQLVLAQRLVCGVGV